MAWIELELDDRTFRALKSQARKEGMTVADLLRRMAARQARVEQAGGRIGSAGGISWDPAREGGTLNAAPRRD